MLGGGSGFALLVLYYTREAITIAIVAQHRPARIYNNEGFPLKQFVDI